MAVLGLPPPGVPDGGHGGHGTRTPLTPWFWAAYSMTTATPGVSAVRLQRQLGIDRDETAWVMLHQLRRAMVDPERRPLAEAVEVDECFVGGPEDGRRGGRQRGLEALVVVAVEVRGTGTGRARLRVVDDASAETLCGFVRDVVTTGATVHTDGWRSHQRLGRLGDEHRPRTPHVHRVPAGDLGGILVRVHRVIGNRKGWRRGTHHGVSAEHRPAYSDEYVFRFDRRRTPTAAFRTLLGLGSHQPPTTYRELLGASRGVAERSG